MSIKYLMVHKNWSKLLLTYLLTNDLFIMIFIIIIIYLTICKYLLIYLYHSIKSLTLFFLIFLLFFSFRNSTLLTLKFHHSILFTNQLLSFSNLNPFFHPPICIILVSPNIRHPNYYKNHLHSISLKISCFFN